MLKELFQEVERIYRLWLGMLPKAILDEPQGEPSMAGQLTRNFHIDEFECHDGTAVPEPLRWNVQLLADQLQALRDHTGKPIKITSGYRHLAYNKSIKGAKNSLHLTAQAADIQVRGILPEEVAKIIEVLIKQGKMRQGGLGIYKTWVHYDTRGFKARWRG